MHELVCDSSALIALHQLRLLSILRSLGSAVFIPQAVATELATGQTEGYDVPEIAAIDWMVVRSPTLRPAPQGVDRIGAGELEAIWLGLERPGSIVVLDDQPARRIALDLGIPITGTLGLLLDAKRHSLITAVAPALDELARHNFHMAPQLRTAILAAADELH